MCNFKMKFLKLFVYILVCKGMFCDSLINYWRIFFKKKLCFFVKIYVGFYNNLKILLI